MTAAVTVTPGEQREDRPRHVALCIDTSGSMSRHDMAAARDGAAWVWELLDDHDHVALVSFDSTVRTRLPAARVSDLSRREYMRRVRALTPGGGTNIYTGVERAAEALREMPDERAAKRLIVLSDGRDGRNDPADYEQLATRVDGHGIRIVAAGLGASYEAATIRTLGTAARGEWTHLETAADIRRFFGRIVGEAASVVAPDARLELDLADGVDLSEVYRTVPQVQQAVVDRRPAAAVVGLADLRDREPQRVSMKLSAPPAEHRGVVTLADLTLRTAGGSKSTELQVRYTDDSSLLAVHNDSVTVEHRKIRIRERLGRGEIADAERLIDGTRTANDVHLDDVETDAARVRDGGRTEQVGATRRPTAGGEWGGEA